MACSSEAHTRYLVLSWAAGGAWRACKRCRNEAVTWISQAEAKGAATFWSWSAAGLCPGPALCLWLPCLRWVNPGECGRGFLEFVEGPYFGKVGSKPWRLLFSACTHPESQICFAHLWSSDGGMSCSRWAQSHECLWDWGCQGASLASESRESILVHRYWDRPPPKLWEVRRASSPGSHPHEKSSEPSVQAALTWKHRSDMGVAQRGETKWQAVVYISFLNKDEFPQISGALRNLLYI